MYIANGKVIIYKINSYEKNTFQNHTKRIYSSSNKLLKYFIHEILFLNVKVISLTEVKSYIQFIRYTKKYPGKRFYFYESIFSHFEVFV